MIDRPCESAWALRQQFCRKHLDPDVRFENSWGAFIISEQACALLMDLETTFCAGAWLSVLITSLSILDAQLRDVELPENHPRGFNSLGNTIDDECLVKEFEWLRQRRNELVHFKNYTAVTVDQCWIGLDLENDARRAIRLVGDVLYRFPLT